MNSGTWVLVGATSRIAQSFGHLVAQQGHPLILVSRDETELNLLAADYQIRYGISCQVIVADSEDWLTITAHICANNHVYLFLGQSINIDNQNLTAELVQQMSTINVSHMAILIHKYLQSHQSEYRLIFLSSVAACRGRAKNSFYGGNKAAIELFLEGLQQKNLKNQYITIARLGFIDTVQTYGKPGIFYAASPRKTAKACLKANLEGKPFIYYPYFWRFIMLMIQSLPSFLFRRLKI